MKKILVAALLLGIVVSHFVLLDFQARGITISVSNEIVENTKEKEALEKKLEDIKKEKEEQIKTYEEYKKWNEELD